MLVGGSRGKVPVSIGMGSFSEIPVGAKIQESSIHTFAKVVSGPEKEGKGMVGK